MSHKKLIFALQKCMVKYKPDFIIKEKKKKKEEYLLNEKCMAYLYKCIL